jgi:hypothetical protein
VPRKLTRKTAIKKLKGVEDKLLTAQAVIGGMARDCTELREWLEGPDKEEKKS